LVVDALEMAVARRRPGPGLVHHSDQGSQYVSLLFGERCREADIEISMGCTSAHDNAVAESFFASLTKDLLRRRALRNRAEARTAVFDYIETFYNPLRLHSTLDYLAGRLREAKKLSAAALSWAEVQPIEISMSASRQRSPKSSGMLRVRPGRIQRRTSTARRDRRKWWPTPAPTSSLIACSVDAYRTMGGASDRPRCFARRAGSPCEPRRLVS
jgi:putative transposase